MQLNQGTTILLLLPDPFLLSSAACVTTIIKQNCTWVNKIQQTNETKEKRKVNHTNKKSFIEIILSFDDKEITSRKISCEEYNLRGCGSRLFDCTLNYSVSVWWQNSNEMCYKLHINIIIIRTKFFNQIFCCLPCHVFCV